MWPNKQAPRIAFVTLGCRLNQAESDSLATSFYNAGYQIVDRADQADVVCINSCTVTANADRKSRYAVRQAAGAHQEALIVLSGCAAASAAGNIARFDTEGLLIVDPSHKAALFDIVDSHLRGEGPITLGPSDCFAYANANAGLHTRGIIKIQDGCDLVCSYCIIPKVRGRAISRPLGDVLNNVTALVESGVFEVVLSGVNMSRYQDDQYDFTDLIAKILAIPLDFRLRIASVEPDYLNPNFAALFSNPKLCPSLHLCLQSGSDQILSAMRRRYSTADYRAMVLALRQHCPDIRITTDLIAGFPGETDADHRQTIQFCRELALGSVHAFSYSRRPGTLANNFVSQVAALTIKQRHAELEALNQELVIQDGQKRLHKEDLILIESVSVKHHRLYLSGLGRWGIEVELDAGPASSMDQAETRQNPGRHWNRLVQVKLRAQFLQDKIIMKAGL